MRNDDQVKAAVAIKKNFVTNTGWEIVCEDEEVKRFLTDMLNNIGTAGEIETTFEDALWDMLTAFDYGFSMTEPVYVLNQDRKWIYKSLKVRPPHSFNFELDRHGNVVYVSQFTDQGELKLRPDIFLHHVYQQHFNNPFGLSDLSAAHADWKAKKYVKRFFAIYLERFATPTTLGRYQGNFQDDEISRFHDMLKTIQNNTTVVVPKETEVEFVQNARDSSDAYVKALNFFNICISRAILVPDLMGLSGSQTKGGSFSLGVEQFDVFLGSIKKERRSLAKKINAKIISPLTRLNFGDKVTAEFRFIPFTNQNILEMAKVWIEAVKGKVWNPSDEEINFLRKLTGFPEGEVDRNVPAAPAPGGFPGALPGKVPPEIPRGDKTGDGKDNGEDKEDEPDGHDRKAGEPSLLKPKFEHDGKFLTFRQKTEYENKMDFAQIESDLDRFETQFKRALNRSANEIIEDYLDQIRTKGIITNFKPEKMDALKPKFMRDMNAEINVHVKDLFKESYESARDAIVVVGKRKFQEALIPEEFLDVLKAESFKLTGDYTTDMTKRAKNVLTDALKSGTSQGTVFKVLRSELKASSERWINTVVRTKTTEVYNNARRSFWENDEIASQIVEAYQFSAILDERTSDICRSLDQNVYSLKDDIQRITPPLHLNCRSLLVPVTKFEDFKTKAVPSVETIQDKGGNLKKFKEGHSHA